MNKSLLADQLMFDEGYLKFPYKDSLDIWTVAVGRNLEGKGLSKQELCFIGVDENLTRQQVIELLKTRGINKEEALVLLSNDIDEVWEQIKKALPWIESKPDIVQRTLVNMGFNMGVSGLLKFKNMLAAIKANDWDKAASEMRNSKWSSQVGDRAKRLSNALLILSE